MISLISAIILASIFASLQGLEYNMVDFTLSDGLYGSTFCIATVFHGFHDFDGILFLFVRLLRLFNQSTQQHHFGFAASA
jgi:cytochrome c oxidase subunit 3